MKRAHNPILIAAGFDTTITVSPWWGGKRLRLVFGYRRYAHRARLTFKAIMTIPQPAAFMALLKGYDGECPCCRRQFDED